MAKNPQSIQRKNWFENHPKFLEIKTNGYDKHNPFMSRAAMLVYLDLCESKHWFDVDIYTCDSLKRVYITGKPRKKADKEIVVPLSVNTSLSVEEIQNVVSEIHRCERQDREDGSGSLGVTLGICDSDSSIVYYRIFNGLVQPSALPADDDDDDNGDCDVFGIKADKT